MWRGQTALRSSFPPEGRSAPGTETTIGTGWVIVNMENVSPRVWANGVASGRSKSLSVVSIKSYGDVVIACHVLRQIVTASPCFDRLEMVAGEHLHDLLRALRFPLNFRTLDVGAEVPAAFDIRKCGYRAAFASLLKLKRRLRCLPAESTLLFDRLGWRERFAGSSHRCIGLQRAGNIYVAYRKTLEQFGYALESTGPRAAPTESTPRRFGVVRIFPSSRLQEKWIPDAVVARISNDLRASNLRCEVIALTGERPGGLPQRTIPRTFGSLIGAIAACDLVVTADSLPGHLAEYLGIPVFVVSPRPNEYWLPLSSSITNGWCLFEDRTIFPEWLMRIRAAWDGKRSWDYDEVQATEETRTLAIGISTGDVGER